MLYSCPNKASVDVIRERVRQIKQEAYTPGQKTPVEELARAAAAYAFVGTGRGTADKLALLWPWDPSSFKPMGCREDLVRAAALLIAAVESLDADEEAKMAELVSTMNPDAVLVPIDFTEGS